MGRLPARLADLKRMNWILTACTAILLVIGAFAVYSADYERVQPLDVYGRHVVWILLGAVCFVAAAMMDYRRIRIHAWWFYAAGVALLVAVLFSRHINHATRWLTVFGRPVLQPSEFAKLALIGVLAVYLGNPATDARRFKTMAVIMGLVAVPVGLVMKEPDLGTAMILASTTFAMMLGGGINGKYLGGIALVSVAVVGIVLAALFLPEKVSGISEGTQKKVWQYTHLSKYQRDRLIGFFDRGKKDDREWASGAGWTRVQCGIAVGSGGLTGKGYLKGTQNILGYLPKSVAPTDFIFSVIAEETGFVGSATILTLFGAVFICGMYVALTAGDKTGRLLCVGIVAMLFSHVFVNVAMTVGLMPIKGLPLPLISFGGSFMVVTMTALGLVQSVYIGRHER